MPRIPSWRIPARPGRPRGRNGPPDIRVARNGRTRVWFEVAIGLIALALGVLTVFWRDWIEVLFNIDPDAGSGAVEWLVVIALLGVGLFGTLLARFEWRRMNASPAATPHDVRGL